MKQRKVIILLANEMDSNCHLNDESLGRADLAAELFKELPADLIIPCGWAYRSDSDIPIAEVLEQYLITEKNIPAPNIHAEIRSRDTAGDAVFTREFLGEKTISEDMVVVTSDYHVERTGLIFELVYGFPVKVVGAATGNEPSLLPSEINSIDAFNQTFSGIEKGNFDAIYLRLLSEHPFYNGNSHPQFS